MGNLYLWNLKRLFHNKAELFWSLFFPVLLGTLFFFSFGNGQDLEKMSAIPVALVEGGDSVFTSFVEELDGTTLKVEKMDVDTAGEALKEGRISGIYGGETEPELTVGASGLEQSILESLLDAYLENKKMMEQIGKENILGLAGAVGSLSDYREMLGEVGISEKSVDNNVMYFYALMGMACLFGAFQGMTVAVELRANLSPLAARRSVSPANRLTVVISEMLAVFTTQILSVFLLLAYLILILGINFGNDLSAMIPVCILGSITGVSFGIFVGSRRIPEGMKLSVLIGGSLFMSFLAGLMFGGIKNVIEQNLPLLNRINPAALIADGFYCIGVYHNPARYRMDLILLGGITVVLTAASFVTLRRESYDSL